MGVHVFSGASIGLLLGLLMGLSTSPMVALVVGALAALLGSVVLPQAKGSTSDTTPHRQEAAAWRSGALALAAMVGLGAGLWMRTHDALSPPRPTLAQQVADLQAAGFGAAEARQLLASRDFPAARSTAAATSTSAAAAPGGSAPAGGGGTAPAPLAVTARSTVLFGADVDTCDRLAPARYANVAAAASAYDAAGFGAFARFAQSLGTTLADEPQRRAVLTAAVGVACAAR